MSEPHTPTWTRSIDGCWFQRCVRHEAAGGSMWPRGGSGCAVRGGGGGSVVVDHPHAVKRRSRHHGDFWRRLRLGSRLGCGGSALVVRLYAVVGRGRHH